MAKVAILGSGNGACTYAAYLGKRGHEVRLYDQERFKDNLTAIKEAGGMNLLAEGNMVAKKAEEEGFGPIFMVTTDAKAAIEGVEVIMVVIPGFGIAPIAKAIAPYLKASQIVMLNPGQVFGALEFLNTLRQCGNNEDVTICEAASNIFACRRVGPTTCRMSGMKYAMEVATIPADRVDYCVSKLDEFFPKLFIPYPNTMYTSLTYLNLVVHPGTAILNMGRIEDTKGNFDFYWEGMTPGVCRNLEAIDAERKALGKALGCDLDDFLFVFHRYYGHPERNTIHEFFTKSEVHGGAGPSAPPDLHYRYVSEDIPYALVPMEAVAKVLGVETPAITAIITLASIANEENYRETGRSLKYMQLEGLSRDQIVQRFLTGK